MSPECQQGNTFKWGNLCLSLQLSLADSFQPVVRNFLNACPQHSLPSSKLTQSWQSLSPLVKCLYFKSYQRVLNLQRAPTPSCAVTPTVMQLKQQANIGLPQPEGKQPWQQTKPLEELMVGAYGTLSAICLFTLTAKRRGYKFCTAGLSSRTSGIT